MELVQNQIQSLINTTIKPLQLSITQLQSENIVLHDKIKELEIQLDTITNNNISNKKWLYWTSKLSGVLTKLYIFPRSRSKTDISKLPFFIDNIFEWDKNKHWMLPLLNHNIKNHRTTLYKNISNIALLYCNKLPQFSNNVIVSSSFVFQSILNNTYTFDLCNFNDVELNQFYLSNDSIITITEMSDSDFLNIWISVLRGSECLEIMTFIQNNEEIQLLSKKWIGWWIEYLILKYFLSKQLNCNEIDKLNDILKNQLHKSK